MVNIALWSVAGGIGAVSGIIFGDILGWIAGLVGPISGTLLSPLVMIPASTGMADLYDALFQAVYAVSSGLS